MWKSQKNESHRASRKSPVIFFDRQTNSASVKPKRKSFDKRKKKFNERNNEPIPLHDFCSGLHNVRKYGLKRPDITLRTSVMTIVAKAPKTKTAKWRKTGVSFSKLFDEKHVVVQVNLRIREIDRTRHSLNRWRRRVRYECGKINDRIVSMIEI